MLEFPILEGIEPYIGFNSQVSEVLKNVHEFFYVEVKAMIWESTS